MAHVDVPSLRQLRAFEAAARLESVSSAAREINLSQPALTQSLHALETTLRTRLFERRRTGCYPTTLGVILLSRVRRFFDHIRSALTEPAIGTPFIGRQSADAIINKLTRPQLRSLVAISENRSFDEAARWLGLAQPSLHRAAKELEYELRRNLYQRTPNGMTTTAQGSELARRFQLAIREIQYGLEEIQAAKGVVISQLAVGNIPHSNNQILSTAINGLLSAHPNVQLPSTGSFSRCCEGRPGHCRPSSAQLFGKCAKRDPPTEIREAPKSIQKQRSRRAVRPFSR